MGGTIWVIEGAPPPGESRGPHFITQAPIEVLNLPSPILDALLFFSFPSAERSLLLSLSFFLSLSLFSSPLLLSLFSFLVFSAFFLSLSLPLYTTTDRCEYFLRDNIFRNERCAGQPADALMNNCMNFSALFSLRDSNESTGIGVSQLKSSSP